MSLHSASDSQPTVVSSVDTSLWQSKKEEIIVESFHALSYSLLRGWLYLVTYIIMEEKKILICACTIHRVISIGFPKPLKNGINHKLASYSRFQTITSLYKCFFQN